MVKPRAIPTPAALDALHAAPQCYETCSQPRLALPRGVFRTSYCLKSISLLPVRVQTRSR